MKLKTFLQKGPVSYDLTQDVIRAFCGWDAFLDNLSAIPTEWPEAVDYLSGRHPDNLYLLIARRHRDAVADLLAYYSPQGRALPTFAALVGAKDWNSVDDLGRVLFGGGRWDAGNEKFLLTLAYFAFWKVANNCKQALTEEQIFDDPAIYLSPDDDGFFDPDLDSDPESPNSIESTEL